MISSTKMTAGVNVYDKRNDFNFNIIKNPRIQQYKMSHVYGIYVPLLLRYSRGYYSDLGKPHTSNPNLA